jgi:hypothetical protein
MRARIARGSSALIEHFEPLEQLADGRIGAPGWSACAIPAGLCGRGGFAGVEGEDFLGERVVVVGAGALGGVAEDRLLEAGSLGQADVAADARLEQMHVLPGLLPATGIAEESLHVRAHFRGEARPRLEQAEHHPGEAEAIVESATHEVDGLQQLAEAVQGEVVRLERQEHVVDRGERVDGEDAKGRRAVDEDRVERLTIWRAGGFGERVAKDELTTNDASKLDFRGREVDMRRSHPEVRLGRLPHLRELTAAGKHLVDIRNFAMRAEAKMQRGVGLGIEVDQTDALAAGGERGAQVDGRRGFADAALLVDDGDGAHDGVLKAVNGSHKSHRLCRWTPGKLLRSTGSAGGVHFDSPNGPRSIGERGARLQGRRAKRASVIGARLLGRVARRRGEGANVSHREIRNEHGPQEWAREDGDLAGFAVEAADAGEVGGEEDDGRLLALSETEGVFPIAVADERLALLFVPRKVIVVRERVSEVHGAGLCRDVDGSQDLAAGKQFLGIVGAIVRFVLRIIARRVGSVFRVLGGIEGFVEFEQFDLLAADNQGCILRPPKLCSQPRLQVVVPPSAAGHGEADGEGRENEDLAGDLHGRADSAAELRSQPTLLIDGTAKYTGQFLTATLSRCITSPFSPARPMADSYDPYREALVMETETEWPEELAEVDRAARARISLALHTTPEQAEHLEYLRTHTGFCRKITVTPGDVERVGS